MSTDALARFRPLLHVAHPKADDLPSNHPLRNGGSLRVDTNGQSFQAIKRFPSAEYDHELLEKEPWLAPANAEKMFDFVVSYPPCVQPEPREGCGKWQNIYLSRSNMHCVHDAITYICRLGDPRLDRKGALCVRSTDRCWACRRNRRPYEDCAVFGAVFVARHGQQAPSHRLINKRERVAYIKDALNRGVISVDPRNKWYWYTPKAREQRISVWSRGGPRRLSGCTDDFLELVQSETTSEESRSTWENDELGYINVSDDEDDAQDEQDEAGGIALDRNDGTSGKLSARPEKHRAEEEPQSRAQVDKSPHPSVRFDSPLMTGFPRSTGDSSQEAGMSAEMRVKQLQDQICALKRKAELDNVIESLTAEKRALEANTAPSCMPRGSGVGDYSASSSRHADTDASDSRVDDTNKKPPKRMCISSVQGTSNDPQSLPMRLLRPSGTCSADASSASAAHHHVSCESDKMWQERYRRLEADYAALRRVHIQIIRGDGAKSSFESTSGHSHTRQRQQRSARLVDVIEISD